MTTPDDLRPGLRHRATLRVTEQLAVPAQGIVAGDLAAALRAMRNGVTYANVHSTSFPGVHCRLSPGLIAYSG